MRTLALLLFLVTSCKSRESKLESAPSPPRDARGIDAAPATVASELEAIRTRLQLPALAVAAWRDGKLLDMQAVGLRKIDDAASKVTTQDKWHVGSNTKAMTAALIAIFVDRGTLRWSDTVGGLLKGWTIDPGFKTVTLDQLIRHEGGVAEQPPDELWKQLWTDGAAPGARTSFVKAILAKPPAQKPGTFVYSNTSYMIAGALLEAKTGKTWEQLMRDELFAKLGMTSCGFGAPGSKDTVDQPWGHDAGGTPIAPGPAADNPPGLGPAGTVHCTLEDYGKFLNMIATGTPALITPEAMQHLQTARGGQYAGGWIVAPAPQGSLLVHSGSNTMWYATAMVAPAKKVAFVVVTNKGEPKLEEELATLLKRLVPAT